MIDLDEHQKWLLENGTFIFDWDGTLFDSMDTKKANFVAVVSNYLEKLGIISDQKILNDIYVSLSGNPRSEIIEKMLTQFGHNIDSSIYGALDSALFNLNKSNLEKCSLFPDTLRVLDRLTQHKRKVCISSSVPQSELDYFFQLVVPSEYKHTFDAVLGGAEQFKKGEPHFSFISSKSRIKKSQFLFIGDDCSDVEIGRESGVSSILIDRSEKNLCRTPVPTIRSLDLICALK
jgi:phosphoglycolate phosphatase-like HAD superfamily hydrolase